MNHENKFVKTQKMNMIDISDISNKNRYNNEIMNTDIKDSVIIKKQFHKK